VYVAGLYVLSGNVLLHLAKSLLPLILSVAAMTAIVMIAAPVKNFLQEQVESSVLRTSI
jgi:hypothetical protein